MLVDLVTERSNRRRRHAIALFTPNAALRDLLRSTDVDVDDRGPVREGPLPYLTSSLGPGDVRWLTDVLRRRRATIVHLHTFGSQVLGTRAAERVGARVVRTEHSTRVYDDPSCWPFSRWSLLRSDAVVYVSDYVRTVGLARAGAALEKNRIVRVVHNGVDTARFVPRPSPPPAGERVRFLALGRLDRRKGIDLTLEAVARTPGAELDIVGDGDERVKLELLASQLRLTDRVRFLGHAADVREAIARADAVVSSARQEGLGIALLEAMAMGRPVVAFKTGGIPEIVVHGQTGWLTAEASVPALARALATVIEDPAERKRRGDAARTHVLERFSVGAMRDQYEALYVELSPR